MSGRHKSKRKKKQPPPRIINVPQEAPREIESQQPRQKESAPKENKITTEHWTAKAGVFLALTVAIIYFLQWRTMTDSVNTARQASEREERAWLDIQPMGDPIINADNTIVWPFHVQNTGKTPARNIAAHIFVEIVAAKSGPDLDYKKWRATNIALMGMIYPQQWSASLQVSRVRFKAGSSTDTEDRPLEPTEHDDLVNGRSYVAAHGIVQYDDTFHVSHWKTFCTWTALKRPGYYNAVDCTAKGNAADDNDEP
jgi:hypothetical protein